MKTVKKQSKVPGRLRRRLILIAGVVTVAVGLGGWLLWYNESVSRQVNAQELTTRQIQLEAQKIANDYKAKVAAELKQKQEAAAKEAAEAAKIGTVVADPKACNASRTHNNPQEIDVLVNKKHCMQPMSYVPPDLVTSNGATLSARAMVAYNQLYTAAAASGQPISVTSSYRSYDSQVSTYNYWVAKSGKQGADTYSARPGYSEHQTGFVIDVAAGGCSLDCFGSTSQYQWLQQYAADYGFIQRYYAGYEAITGYKSEEWHYRYVGVEVAKDLKAKGIKTLEEYWGLSGGDYY